MKKLETKILKNDGHVLQCDICYEMERRDYKDEEEYWDDCFRGKLKPIKYKIVVQIDKRTFDKMKNDRPEEYKDVFARIAYYGKKEYSVEKYTTRLDLWLKGKNLEFKPVKYAKFGKSTLSVVEFDRDHCIYIVLPKDVFKKDMELLPITND